MEEYVYFVWSTEEQFNLANPTASGISEQTGDVGQATTTFVGDPGGSN